MSPLDQNDLENRNLSAFNEWKNNIVNEKQCNLLEKNKYI